MFWASTATLTTYNDELHLSSGTNNTSLGTGMGTGLTLNTRYYLFVSGYGRSDTPG